MSCPGECGSRSKREQEEERTILTRGFFKETNQLFEISHASQTEGEGGCVGGK